ncbi:MAG: SUMF1/EgtB/PvdO family nonheme iron enzyme [Isosphaeraceae bacterium]|nr:SUMF1/EgtB/PvdO family nonheme iron enzyme [Isosphaeraceae bacterium]
MSSLNDAGGLPTEEKNLIVVAAVNHVLHFRMFDGDGKTVVDTNETKLPKQARHIEDLRKQLEPPHELTKSEKTWVIAAVTSIVGHTPEEALAALSRELLGDEPVDDIREYRLVRDTLWGLPETQSPQRPLVIQLWDIVKKSPSPARRLRAVVALATFDPQGRGWTEVVRDPAIVGELIAIDRLLVRDWARALEPICERFVPALEEVFLGKSQCDRAEQRITATLLLAEFISDTSPELVRLILESEMPTQVAILARRLPKGGAPNQDNLASLKGVVDRAPKWPLDPYRFMVEHEVNPVDRPAQLQPDADWDSRRRANAAAALIHLGEVAPALAVLRHTPDPMARTYLIHSLNALGVRPATLMDWLAELDKVDDVSARRAVLLALGEDGGRSATKSEQMRVKNRVTILYQSDPDPGVHSAAEWVLRQWGLPRPELTPTPEGGGAGPQLDPGRRWYINANGHTMVVLPEPDGPRDVLMGTPALDQDYNAEKEQLHLRHIPRRFAIAAHETTIHQFETYFPGFWGDESHSERSLRERRSACDKDHPSHPIDYISWYHAAAYCNWLSCQAGIDRSQWCYPEIDRDRLESFELDYLGGLVLNQA